MVDAPPLWRGAPEACPRCGAAGTASPHASAPEYDSLVCPNCGLTFRRGPDATPENQPRRAWFVLTLLAGTAVVVVGIVVGAALSFAHHGGQSYPSSWDPQVAPITARVEVLRGLRFKHPVKVNYLSPAAFEKKLTASPADLKKARNQIDQGSAMLRAAGLVGANVDLADAVNTTQASDTLAFYDFHAKQIFLRAGTFTVETRVTLAHELTHVLQDQYFDLPKLRRQAEASKTGSSDAFTALSEGDATRIENQYLGEQSASDRREYDRLSTQDSSTATKRTKDVPEIIQTYFGAPYIFGPSVIDVLETSGGNEEVNDAISGATPSTRIYFDPLDAQRNAGVPPAIPALQPGEQRLRGLSGNDSGFDPFTFYVMLAAHLDRPTALLAADAFYAGSEVRYRAGNTTCFRAAVLTITPGSVQPVADIVRGWTRAVPDAGTDATNRAIVFHSCDPAGRAANPPNQAIREAVRLLASRDALIATFIRDKVPRDAATCFARVLVEQPDVRDALLRGDDLNTATPQMQAESYAAASACRSNSNAGLPSSHSRSDGTGGTANG